MIWNNKNIPFFCSYSFSDWEKNSLVSRGTFSSFIAFSFLFVGEGFFFSSPHFLHPVFAILSLSLSLCRRYHFLLQCSWFDFFLLLLARVSFFAFLSSFSIESTFFVLSSLLLLLLLAFRILHVFRAIVHEPATMAEVVAVPIEKKSENKNLIIRLNVSIDTSEVVLCAAVRLFFLLRCIQAAQRWHRHNGNKSFYYFTGEKVLHVLSFSYWTSTVPGAVPVI